MAVKALSLRAYAAHRKGRGLPGGSLQAVQRAIAGGRLASSLVKVDGGVRIADVDAADREWAANTDLSRAPDQVKLQAAGPKSQVPGATVTELEPQPHGGALKRTTAVEGDDVDEDEEPDTDSLAHWSKEEKQWRAKSAELRYRERAGELVEAAEMQAAMADAFSMVRTKLLGVPSKAKQRLPHLTLDDLATIEEIVREALEEIAGAGEPGKDEE